MRLKYIFLLAPLCASLLAAGLYFYMYKAAASDIVKISELERSDAIIVLGAKVYGEDSVSVVLANRLNTGLLAYQRGGAPKIIVSGDHGQTDYDEVEAMKNYLLARGVPRQDIFLDHAGFTTYDSIYRAKEVFGVQKALIVSQRLHLERALFIARQLGLPAKGLPAPTHERDAQWQAVREVGARVKAFWQAAVLKPQPRFLGEKIPVTGDGSVTR